MTPEGIADFVASNPRSGGEGNLLSNDLKTPYSDQFSLGMRNLVQLWRQDWNTSVTLSHIRSQDGIYFRFGNRWPGGNFHENPDATRGGHTWGQEIPGSGSLILGHNGTGSNPNPMPVSTTKPHPQHTGRGVHTP